MAITSPQSCAITLNIPNDAREAGYQARCTDCGRLYRSAEEWVGATCVPPKEVGAA